MSLLFQMRLKEVNFFMSFVDPKNSDAGIIGEMFSPDSTVVNDGSENFTKDTIKLVDDFYKKMIERQKELKSLVKGKVATDYRAFDLEPHYLMIDELPSLVAAFDKDEEKEFIRLMKQISAMGAGLGFFIIVIAQRLSTKTLPKEIQANMLNKIILGNADNQTYMTAIDRVEDVPSKKFGKGEGVFKDDSMSKPLMVNFPYLKYLDEADSLEDVLNENSEGEDANE